MGTGNYFRPLPAGQLQLSLPVLPEPASVQVAWPSFGQAALAAQGYGELGTHGANTPLATASIAKVITALCVLEKHPIAEGTEGGTITIGRADRLFYEEQITLNGSRLPVFEGQKMSQYEALQALMVPSANNIADTLAVWAFGNHAAYAEYANSYLARHGLVMTRVGTDASGLDATTRSTAEDLAKLGLIAAKNETLMEIAGQQEVEFSYGGTYDNYNSALGTHGITGLKTGNNDENPGALLFTAQVPVGSESVEVSGAVMGADDLQEAIRASQTVVANLADSFEQVRYVQRGATVGTFTTEWGTKSTVRAERDIEITRWKAREIERKVTSHPTAGDTKATVGELQISSDSSRATTSLVLASGAGAPSWWWRVSNIR